MFQMFKDLSINQTFRYLGSHTLMVKTSATSARLYYGVTPVTVSPETPVVA